MACRQQGPRLHNPGQFGIGFTRIYLHLSLHFVAIAGFPRIFVEVRLLWGVLLFELFFQSAAAHLAQFPQISECLVEIGDFDATLATSAITTAE